MIEQRESDRVHLNWLSKLGIESFQGKRILDLGCGSGFVCHKAMQDGATLAVGVDIIEPKHNASWNFRKLDLNSPTWHQELNSSFDLILAFDIIEHLDSPFLFLTSCRKLLDVGGSVVLTTPNLLSWERYAKPKSWSGVQDAQHKILFTKYSLEFLLSKAGFQVTKTQAPMRLLSFLGPLQPHVGGQIVSVSR